MLSKLLKSQLIFLFFVLTACGGGGGNNSSSSSSSPVLDTDGDGYPDTQDAFPNDPTEWSDADGDRVGDNGDETPMGMPIPQWTTTQGNAQHTGHRPVTLDSSDFAERWRTTTNYAYPSDGSAGDGYLFFNHNNTLHAINAANGNTVWTQQVTSTNSPAYSNGTVYIQSSGFDDTFLLALDASNGDLLYKIPLLNNWNNLSVPTIADGIVYFIDSYSGSLNALDAVTGVEKWSTSLISGGMHTAAVNNEYVVVYTQYSSPRLIVTNKNTGAIEFEIADSGFDFNTWGGAISTPAIEGSTALIIQGDRLINFDLGDRSVAWQYKLSPSGQPAIHNQRVYVINAGNLEALNLTNGTLQQKFTEDETLIGSPIVTNNLVFVRDERNIYAYELDSGVKVWTLPSGDGEKLLMAEGALYVLNYNGVTAIDVEGDIDGDALPDWWEKRLGKNLDPNGDTDNDGLTATEEFNYFTNPLVADSDNDGLSDSDEINIHFSSPLHVDTDRDGLNDGEEIKTYFTNPNLKDSDSDQLDDDIEILFALDPNNASDAADDNDNDGYNNLHEVMAHTDFNNALSIPVVSDWGMKQANAKHNGFQPIILDSSKFNLRWSKTFPHWINQIATTGKNITVASHDYQESRLTSLSVKNGEKSWQYDFDNISFISAPSYDNGIVYVHGGEYSDAALWAFNANSGERLFRTPHESQWPRYSSPTIFDGGAYVNGGYYDGVLALNAATGTDLWSSNSAVWGDEWEPAVNDAYVFHPLNGSIISRHRATGEQAFVINGSFRDITPVLGTRNNILLRNNYVQSYDLSTRSLLWESQQRISTGIPTVGNNSVYFISDYKLVSISEITGKERWTWVSQQVLNSNVIATISHIFVSDGDKTYALSSFTGELLWSYNIGGNLSLGRDGALYITKNTEVYAINLMGDSDADGMPDWWEQLYGLNINNSADALLDLDGDGLTNLGEFTANTDASLSDSDADGLNDYAEINEHQTNPNNNDSDSDGMPDAWEISIGLDPNDYRDRNLDLDGDGVNNYFELLENTDPTDALSSPTLFSPGIFSFEDAQLPAGWWLSDESTSVSISSDEASDGAYSLLSGSSSSIVFEGFFKASDISFDVKSNCPHQSNVEVYVDDKLLSRLNVISEWTTLSSVIPYGRHQVSLRIALSSCSIYIDNIVIAPAATTVELALQTVVLNDRTLQFLNDEGRALRSIVLNPALNHHSSSLAMVGLDKVVVAFNGYEPYIGILDLNTFLWSYKPIADAYLANNNNSIIAAHGDYIYASVSNGLVKINIDTWETEHFGAHNYNAIAVDRAGIIYAHSNGVLYRYDPETLTLINNINIQQALAIAVDDESRIIVATYSNTILRYNEQRLIDKQIALTTSVTDIAINIHGQLIVASQYNSLRRYNKNWNSYTEFNTQGYYLDVINQPDTDGDNIPDWWELRFDLNINSASDANNDDDNDLLTALEEFTYLTDPDNPDTDGDLLTDGDEINDFNTDPTSADTDGDQLTDSEELLTYFTNPLLADSDSDSFNDRVEIFQYNTDPNDANSLPDAIMNFSESFETTLPVGWEKPVSSQYGWSIVSDSASEGSQSLRSNDINDRESAEIVWEGLFAESTLTFDAKVSSESCCDYLLVYVDDQPVTDRIILNEWQSFDINLTAGEHIIRWVYIKDGSLSSGDDSAWIDNITIH